MALDFSDLKTTQVAGTQAQNSTAQGKRPYLDFSDLKEKQQQVIEPEVMQQVTAAPQPSQNPTVSVSDNQPAPVDTSRFMQGAGAGGQGTLGNTEAETALEESQRTGQNVQDIYTQHNQGFEEFLRDEGLPMAGAFIGGALATAFTGGMAAIPAVAAFATASGVGGAIGEAVEQGAKESGLIIRSADETPIKSGYDFAERVAWQGVEEAAWAAVPEMLVRGASSVVKNYVAKNAPKSIPTLNTSAVIRQEAELQGVEAPVLLSDVVDSSVGNLLEAIGGQSFLAKGATKAAHQGQKDLVASAINRAINKEQSAIARLAGAGAELNSIGVASMINTAFKKVEKAQKTAAGLLYNEIDTALRNVKPRMRVQPDGSLAPVADAAQYGSFRVDTTGLKDIAKKERTSNLLGTGQMPEIDQLFGVPDSATPQEAFHTLKALRSSSRSLAKGTADNAANRKRIVDDAINVLEGQLNLTLTNAESLGVRTASGRSVTEVMQEADELWKMTNDEFGNSYIEAILKETDKLNGAPDKLADLFIKNEVAADNILRILNKPEYANDGQILAAKSAIRGSVMKDIFMPIDVTRGKSIAPRYKDIEGRKEVLVKLFGQEDYENMVKLADAFAVTSGEARKNALAFAQGARESGALISAADKMLSFVPMTLAGSATAAATSVGTAGWGLVTIWATAALADAAGASGRNLTKLAMLVDKDVSQLAKRNIFRELIHTADRAARESAAAVTPDQLERRKEESDDYQQYLRERENQQK